MNYLHVNCHLLTNGRGDMAPAVYCCLSKWEMPSDELIIWEVKGLSIGGHGAHCSTGVGYVLSMRGTSGAEKKRFQWIRDHALMPFIN